MAIVLKEYTHPILNRNDIIDKVDYLELQDNSQKILEGFNTYIRQEEDDPTKTMHVKSIGENQHALATSLSSGFADPKIIYKDPDNPEQLSLQLLEENINGIMSKYQYDAYPELAIVVWSGNHNDPLPAGWYPCDGRSVTLPDGTTFTTPDLGCYIPVTVTPTRIFMSKRTYTQKILAEETQAHSDGATISKSYIIKAPFTYADNPKTVKLKVVQPDGIRIATNYTTCDPEVLDTLPAGHTEDVDIPYGAKVVVSRIKKTNYEIGALAKTDKYSSTAVSLNTPINIYTNTAIQATYINQVTDFVQPVLTENGTLGLDDNAIISYGDGSAIDKSFYLMDGKENTYRYWHTPEETTEARIIFFTEGSIVPSQVKIKVSPGNIIQQNQYINDLVIAASNDGMTWETLSSTSPGKVSVSQELTIPISTPKKYMYFVIDFVGGKKNFSDYTAISNITFSGKTVTPLEYEIVEPDED